MYIDLGGDRALSDRYIVAILDMDVSTQGRSKINEFFSCCEQKDCIEFVGMDVPRSAVICMDRVIMTPLSPQTLQERLKEGIHVAENLLKEIEKED